MVMAESHGNGLVLSIHHVVRPSNLQHAVWPESAFLDQSPWRFEPTVVTLTSLLAQGIFDAGWAMCVDLRRAGTEVGFVVKCGRELLGVIQ